MGARLADLLQAELKQMQPYQKSVFRRELAKTLPPAIKTAADKAKQGAETAQAEGMSENVRKK